MTTQNKTKLYKEAVLEARELRAAAEKQVKQQLLEELSPVIKKTLEKHFVAMTEQTGLETVPDDAAALAGETVPVAPEPTGIEVTDTAKEVETTPPAVDVPVTPVGDANQEVNIPLPGVDGKITVSVEDLFSRPNEVIKAVDQVIATPPAEAIADDVAGAEVVPPLDSPVEPSDVATVGSAEDASGTVPLTEVRARFLNLVEYVGTQVEERKEITSAQAEKLQFSLIALQEESEELLINGIIEARDYQLCKKRAEKIQKSLQEKLISEKIQNSYIQHNQKIDGESMAIKKSFKELFEETEVTFGDLDTDKARKEADADQTALEKQTPDVQDIGQKAKEGDWDKEGAAAAKSENAKEKSALDEALELFKQAIQEDHDVVDGISDAPAEETAPAAEGSDEEYDIAALLQAFEDQLETHGIDVSDLDVTIGGEQGDKEVELEFGLDDEGKVAELDGAAAPAGDDEESALVVAEAAKALKAARKIISEARAEKSELELYNFKTVCLNKLLMREAVSTVVEKKAAIAALDNGTTIKEVESIFNRIIQTKLQESKVTKNGKSKDVTDKGMISESVNRGSSTLNEGKDPFIARLMQLANVKE